jgi:3-hydroxyisobutyrate dehydrogenase-like beta-hydroxyacid dehydrogenase
LNDSRIGFLGLGTMGAAMARRLVQAGYEVTVYNRTPERSAPFRALGARIATTPAEVAESSDYVLSCLWDTAAVEHVFLGNDGLLGASRPGQIFVEHATFAPAAARDIAACLRDRGADFVDAPVTGGPEGAASGTLTAMVGGANTTIDAVANILACYAQKVIRVGDVGCGLELKLINQLLVSCHFAAAAEAAALIRELQLPQALSQEVLVSGWASSTMLARSLPRAATEAFESDGATIGGLLESQELVAGFVNQVELPQFNQARALFGTAVSQGLADLDPSALVLTYQEIIGG